MKLLTWYIYIYIYISRRNSYKVLWKKKRYLRSWYLICILGYWLIDFNSISIHQIFLCLEIRGLQSFLCCCFFGFFFLFCILFYRIEIIFKLIFFTHRVYLEVIEMEEYHKLSRFPEIKPPHQMQFSVKPRTLLCGGGVLTLPRRYNICILIQTDQKCAFE